MHTTRIIDMVPAINRNQDLSFNDRSDHSSTSSARGRKNSSLRKLLDEVKGSEVKSSTRKAPVANFDLDELQRRI